LERLGMIKADLYQIHAPIHPASIEVVGKRWKCEGWISHGF
jgi:hypothetical protein